MVAETTPKTILLVEDNELILTVLHDFLEVRGYSVLETRDGIEAVKLARRHRPDLILMDIRLPEVSGLDITKWMKQEDELKSVPIVAVTACAMPGDEARFRRAGGEAYLAKPFGLARFLDTVERFLGPAAEAG